MDDKCNVCYLKEYVTDSAPNDLFPLPDNYFSFVWWSKWDGWKMKKCRNVLLHNFDEIVTHDNALIRIRYHHKASIVQIQHSGYHPQTSVTELKHRLLRIVLGWGTPLF